MKIAYIVPGLDPTGPIIVVRNLIQSLISTNHRIDLYYIKDRDRIMDFPCNVKKIDTTSPIDFDKYDIIHSHCYSADCYVKKWRHYIKKAITITTIHQDTFASVRYTYLFPISYLIARQILNVQSKFNGIIAISKQVKDIHQPYFRNDIKVIYNGINFISHDIVGNNLNPDFIESIRTFKSDASILLGTYANIVKRKGLSQVFKVLVQNRDYRFVIIGDGLYKNDLIKESKDLGISKQVLFLPFVESPYLYFNDIDVYCMPSYSEGFGLALLEAAYSNKAIVCSDLPSFHELFTDEVVFFKPDDINSLSDAIGKAYSNKNEYGLMAHGRAKEFTKEIMARKHLEYYKELLK